MAARQIDTCSVTDPDEIALYVRLDPGRRLRSGECSAIAVALRRRDAIAMDDQRAIRRALDEARLGHFNLEILRTPDIMVTLIRCGVLDVDAADRIKDDWATHHRFRLKIASFQDLI